MIVPQTSRIVDFMGEFYEKWCVYEIWTYNEAETRDECIYIGVCRLVHLFNFPDARRNTEWPKRVTQRTVITVIIRASGCSAPCNRAPYATRKVSTRTAQRRALSATRQGKRSKPKPTRAQR
jgi:hypothetical protein